MKKFALIGIAGFIAPRHLSAIRNTGNTLVAALDKFDNVGILDSYFPDAHFFTEFERFDRHIDKQKRKGSCVDFVSICTPNYLHDSHVRFALRHNADAICEKPLVLNPWNIDGLRELEIETGNKVNNILQLRLHPDIVALKQQVVNDDKSYDIDLTYITSRGNWYKNSWKGDISKSGGIATNIGIHFFDMLIWIFGSVEKSVVNVLNDDCASGILYLKEARVRWFLSINRKHLPENIRVSGKQVYRSIKVDGTEIDFSDGFSDLHTRSYEEIINGDGFSLDDVTPAIELVHKIRQSEPIGAVEDYHPILHSIG